MPALSSSLSEILIKNHRQQPSQESWLNKVPPITLAFWVIKIMSTTVGETVADLLGRRLATYLPSRKPMAGLA